MRYQGQLNRREMLKTLCAGAGAVLLSGCASRAPRGEEAGIMKKQPNIVFVIADDMGWADIGYHASEVRTPNLDALAAQGVIFDQHYATPTCTPTRVGIMTGKYPSRYGVLAPAYGDIFGNDTTTLAAALSAAGYQTSLSGKWHMGSPPDCVPRKYGFKTSYGYFHGQIDPYTHLYKTGESSWHRDDEFLEEEGHATDLITDEAVRIIESHTDAPFFLYVAYSVPHYPLDEPEEWKAPYEGIIEDACRREFAASVTHMDHGIGRIVEALDKQGLRDNTVLIFISDNGAQESWHSTTQYGGRYADKPHTTLGCNLPLRGWKTEVHDGGIRVPAFIQWPGVLDPGVLEAPMHIVDWMPTLCGLGGYEAVRDLGWEGRDMWPVITGVKQEPPPRTLYWRTPDACALRDGDWKLVRNEDGSRQELYHLGQDPYETTDLSAEEPERVARLQALMEQHRADDQPRR